MNKALLIIPCYNEEKRLNINSFKQADENIDFIFANDGSTDNTRCILSSLIDEKRFYLFNSEQNLGKANIIQHCYQYINEHKLIKEYDIIGYWDADLATPLYEVNNMLLLLNEHYEAIWGSRISRLGSKITRNKYRHYLGRIFATIVSITLKVKSYDSQCGAKIFKKDIAKIAFQKPFITNWIFDIEILMRVDNAKILEYPLLEWTDIEGSKVNIKKEFPKVLKDIFLLRKKYIGD